MKARTFTNGQNGFSKAFYEVGNKNYLTDIDSMQVGDTILDTENEVYYNYTIVDNNLLPKRYIEVKWDMTASIRRQISGEDEPSIQTRAVMQQVELNNAYFSAKGEPEMSFVYVVQTKGNYPYYVYDVSRDFLDQIRYTMITKFDNEEDLQNGFR